MGILGAMAGRWDDAPLDRIAEWAVRPHARAFRLGFALTCLLLATVLRRLLEPVLPDHGFPFMTFYPALALIAFVSGLRVALAGIGVAMGLGWLLFMEAAPDVPPLEVGGALLLFAMATGTPSLLVATLRRAFARLAAAVQAEAAAQEQARMRSLMFSELQHRVSNHLGVAGSLLSLQRREMGDARAARALEEAARRLRVIARLSRLLHDPGAQEVDMGAFLRALAPEAVAAGGAEGRARLEVLAEGLWLPAERAVPLGLVAAELIANALEHGVGQGEGRVRVSLRETQEGWARLQVEDDGPGLPRGFDIERAESLGLSVARQFAGQLGGRLRLASAGGVIATLDLPLAPPVAAASGARAA